MNDPVQFALAALLLLAAPGPTNTMLAMGGAVNRTDRPWLFVAAMLAGYLTIIVISRAVLLPLIDINPMIGVALKCVVVVYLIYAAIRLWRTPIAQAGVSTAVRPSFVFTTTALNPKGLIFAIAIFPRTDANILFYFAAFALLTILVGACWFAAGRGLGLLSGSRVSLIPRVGAAVLAGFAAYLAASLVG